VDLSLFPNNCTKIKRPDETIINIVEIAAIVGSIWSLRARNILRVMVELSPPATKSEIIISSNDVRNAMSDAETIENFICGNVISQKAWNLVAPSDLATFSWFMS